MNAETTAVEKTRISPKIEDMVKTKSGSFHKDDFIGGTLDGLNIDQVKEIAKELGLDANKYDHLNVGQQRMNLGNRLRAMTARNEGHSEEAAATVDKARDTVESMADGFRATNEAEAAAEAETKAAAKAKAEKAAAAKPSKVKEPAPIEGEGSDID
jgi:hypothetical protein